MVWNWHRTVIFALLLPILFLHSIACQKETPTKPTTKKNQPAKTEKSQEKTYLGVSLDIWKDRLKNFEPENESTQTYIPGLLEIVQDDLLEWHVRKSAAFALARLGEPAQKKTIPVLLKLSKAKENPEETQIWAGKSIAKFGPLASIAASELRERLLREEGTLIVRLTFVDAMSQIGTNHPLAIPTLIEVLQKSKGSQLESIALREASLLGLMSLGPSASPATLALIDSLSDSHEGIRSKAAMTLEQVGPLASSAAAPLTEMIILEESLEARSNAAKALVSIGPSAVSLVDQLLNDEDVLVRRAVSYAVIDRKKFLPELRTSVLKNLSNKDDQVKINSIESLMNDPSYKEKEDLLKNIVLLLESNSRTIRVKSIELLVRLPVKKLIKKQEIDRFLDHPRREVRSAVKEAIKRLSTEE